MGEDALLGEVMRRLSAPGLMQSVQRWGVCARNTDHRFRRRPAGGGKQRRWMPGWRQQIRTGSSPRDLTGIRNLMGLQV